MNEKIVHIVFVKTVIISSTSLYILSKKLKSSINNTQIPKNSKRI